MWEIFNWVRAAIFILCAIGFVHNWYKRGFWLPPYVHVIAGLTFFGSCVALHEVEKICPIDPRVPRWELFAIAGLLTAIVYVVFVLYGGADAAWIHQQQKQQKAIENAGIPAATIRRRERELVRLRCKERLRLGRTTVVAFVAALLNSILLAALLAGVVPLWCAALLGAVSWGVAVMFFVFAQTFRPAALMVRYIVITAILTGFWIQTRTDRDRDQIGLNPAPVFQSKQATPTHQSSTTWRF